MNIKDHIKIAVFNIRSSLARSLLTMLGIIIGVSSVIAIVTIGNGGKDYIVTSLESSFSGFSTIRITDEATDHDYITEEDLKAIKKLDSVASVTPTFFDVGSMTTGNKAGVCVLVPCNQDYKDILRYTIKYGRFFNEQEYQAARTVGVIDTMSAQNLYGYENVIGETMQVKMSGKTVKFKIIGVFEAENNEMATTATESLPDSSLVTSSAFLVLPYTTYAQVSGSAMRFETIYVAPKDSTQVEQMSNAVINLLQARHNNFNRKVYSATTSDTYISFAKTIINVFTGVIAAASAISLVVGGIGVMNIMLVSVMERTREIGIRKALGARTNMILMQFLTESVIICFIGGIIGILLGIFIALIVSSILEMPLRVQASTILVAIGFSSAIGIFFGIYPAKRAASMPPIEALRRE